MNSAGPARVQEIDRPSIEPLGTTTPAMGILAFPPFDAIGTDPAFFFTLGIVRQHLVDQIQRRFHMDLILDPELDPRVDRRDAAGGGREMLAANDAPDPVLLETVLGEVYHALAGR